MPNGQFINFNIPFLQNGAYVSSQSQAKQILTKAQSLINDGAIGVAITYSANYGQTLTIESVYASGGWDTHTNGANQAAVMSEMESLMGSTYQSLQGRMRIAPITTMNAYTNPLNPWNEHVQMGIVENDLDRIQQYLQNGWMVLGWQNQDTVTNATYPYAVGGGVVKPPQAITNKIQVTLIQFSKTYKS